MYGSSRWVRPARSTIGHAAKAWSGRAGSPRTRSRRRELLRELDDAGQLADRAIGVHEVRGVRRRAGVRARLAFVEIPHFVAGSFV